MTVVIYGATGLTGQLVGRALQRAGQALRLVGRSEARLRQTADTLAGAPPWQVAPVDDPPALDAALEGASLLINCAGPFVETASPVMLAALRNRVPYIDVSGEGRHVADVYERWHGPAVEAGVPLCPGIGAVGAFGDWGAHVIAAALRRPPEAVDVTYVHSTLQFLRLSDASMLSAASQEFLARTMDTSELVKTVRAPAPFGPGGAIRISGAEQWSIPRHLPGCRARTFFSIDPGGPFNPMFMAGLSVGFPLLPAVVRLLTSDWGRFQRRAAERALVGSGAGPVSAVLVDGTAEGQHAEFAVIGRDAYEVSADVVTIVVQRIIDGTPLPAGVLAPSQVSPPIQTLRALQQAGRVVLYSRVGVR